MTKNRAVQSQADFNKWTVQSLDKLLDVIETHQQALFLQQQRIDTLERMIGYETHTV